MAPFPANNRSITYNPVNSVGPFPVGSPAFPLFDETGADLRVTLNGEEVGGWTFSGTIESGFYGAPNTWVNGSITFASPISGELIIDGDRMPRRQAQFREGSGVPARDHNTELNTLTAIQQEHRRRLDSLDRPGGSILKRLLRVPRGESVSEIPASAARSNRYLGFGPSGQPVAVMPPAAVVDTAQVIFYATFAISGFNIGPTIQAFRTLGYYVPGDGGGAVWARSEVAGPGYGLRRSADGAWWRLGEKRPTVRQFGAVGNGIADDAGPLQEALDFVSLTGGVVVVDAGDYKHMTSLVSKVRADAAPVLPGSEIHYSQSNPLLLSGLGRARIVAGAAMTQQLKLTYDTSDADIAQWWSKIDSLEFDGGELAEINVDIDWTMHATIERCRMWNATQIGLRYLGYGVFNLIYNSFDAPICIYLNGGGDSWISHNDMQPTSIGIVFGPYSGNGTVISNIITNQSATAGVYAMRLAPDWLWPGQTPDQLREVRDLRIMNNEFCGCTCGVVARTPIGYRLNWNILVFGNNTNPIGALNPGGLCDIRGAMNVRVMANNANKEGYGAASAENAIILEDCDTADVHDNTIQQYNGRAIFLRSCVRTRIRANRIMDCGMAGASGAIIAIEAGCLDTVVNGNDFAQTSASYAQWAVYEYDGAENSRAFDNRFTGVLRPYRRAGSASIMRRDEIAPAIPTVGRYHRGDLVRHSLPAISGTIPNRYVATGWSRLTDGETHVYGTDWIELRSAIGEP